MENFEFREEDDFEMENVEEEDDMANEQEEMEETSKREGPDGGYGLNPPNIQIKAPGSRQKRRSKNDANGRDYVCGCGKTYLSYPALYTHIKTKHNGKTPDGTNANQVSSVKGRGRPRKNFLIKEEEESLKRKRRLRHEASLEDKHPEIKEMLNQGAGKERKKEHEEKMQDTYMDLYRTLQLLGGPCQPAEGFPNLGDGWIKESFRKNYEILLDKVDFILINGLEQNLLGVDPLDQHAHLSATCDEIFALFLIDMSKLFNLQFYKTFVIFIKSYRECMNKLGWEILSHYKDLSKEPTELDYTTIKRGEHLPEIANDFVGIFLPCNLPSFDKYLSVIMTNQFCDWLYKHEFTNMKVNFIQEINSNS